MCDGHVISGAVKRAYPLQSLSSLPNDNSAASPAGGELGAFGPGVGPCGLDASHIVAILVENRTTFETCLVFFYDKWANKMQFLKRHYKVRISGQGLVALEWEAGVETEERVQCVVVAERNVLKKTLDRQPRLFTFPHSLLIEVVYEEPQRLPESDQLRYLPSKSITTRDLHAEALTRQALIHNEALPRKKVKHGKRMLEQAKETSPAYRYSLLSELVDGYADLYGVVVNMTLPKKTSGRDFCMTISVTDESCPTRAAAIQINIFYPTIAKMPKIKFVGDIIRLHKVKIQQFRDRVQGLSLHRATRHLVLRQRASGELEQLTNSDTWTFELSDERRTRELINWAKKSIANDDTLPQGCPLAPKFLSELNNAESFIDLVVRVLHVEDSEVPTRLIVWDGSGNAAESDRALVQALQDRSVCFPAYGLLKEVIMASCWPVVHEMGFVDEMLTKWCRFRNLAVGIDEPSPGAAAVSGSKEILRFREVTSFVLVPEFALDVQRRLLINRSNTGTTARGDENCALFLRDESVSSSDQAAATGGVVEVVTVVPDHILKNIPVTSLREIVNSSQIPRKYHCCAHVRSIRPADITKLCKPTACDSSEFIYSFALVVQEGCDSINIIVYGKDAEHFLHGIPPCDLSKSTSSRMLVEKRCAALLKVGKAVHLCIKSYSISLPPGHSNDPNRAVRYRLFNTMLRCT